MHQSLPCDSHMLHTVHASICYTERSPAREQEHHQGCGQRAQSARQSDADGHEHTWAACCGHCVCARGDGGANSAQEQHRPDAEGRYSVLMLLTHVII